MPKFQLAAYPCEVLPDGIVQVVVTGRFKLDTVECSMERLPAVMAEFAKSHAELQPKSIYVSAEPTGRAPNGWKRIVAVKGDEYVLNKAAAVIA